MPNSTKSWTFMVYMAGDNDLDPNGIKDLKEMKPIGTNADINVIAQFDSESANHGTTRYLLTNSPLTPWARLEPPTRAIPKISSTLLNGPSRIIRRNDMR